MDALDRLSFRDTVLGPGEPSERFKRCLAEAKRFIDGASVAAMLEGAFESDDNRRSVMDAVRDSLHVGFIFPGDGLSAACMRASAEACLLRDPATFPSAVVAKELGALGGCTQIPTMVFSASSEEVRGGSRYVEVFIPSAGRKRVLQWVAQEVGTHIGLTVATPSEYGAVRAAFQAEGYRMAPFMRGKPIRNIARGVKVAYFEKRHDRRTVRIEALSFLDGDIHEAL